MDYPNMKKKVNAKENLKALKIEKAKALANSRPLNFWRLSDYREAIAAVDHVFNELLDAGLVKKRYQSKWRDLTRTLVLDLFVTHMADPTMYVSYWRTPIKYKVDSRYGAFFISGNILIEIVDFLEKGGYIEHTKGFKDKDTGKGRISRMRATSKLMTIVRNNFSVTVPMVGHNPEEQVIILRDANKKDIEYEDTPQVVKMRENVQLINASLAKHAILLYVTDEELSKLQDRLEHKINFADKRIRRIFNNESWEQGGRFFGGWWQNVPREYRHMIRINDKDVVECDFAGLHINMLYAMTGLPSPKGDVYNVPGYSNDKTFRDFVKRLLLILINSEDRSKARGAIQDAVMHNKTLTLPAEIPSICGEHIYPLMDAFEAKHEPIKHYFCTSIGIDLQNMDSVIAEQILVNFSKRKLAILPIHDSFILHHGLEQSLRDAMNMAFKDMFGLDSKIDLKYNSITERHKLNEGFSLEPYKT
jgi:hypothetical protein